MKKLVIPVALLLMSSFSRATPITLQHTKTTYVNSGICSALVDVTIHDFLMDDDKLYLDLVAKDKTGEIKVLSKNVITYEDVQNISGKALGGVFLESEDICGSDRSWTISVTRAVLQQNGVREDLLKTKQVMIENFQPMKIVVKK